MEPEGASEPRSEDLDGELNVVAGHLNALHARLVDVCVAMIADRSTWAGPGVERPELYLAWKVGLSTARAKQIVEIAERADELPATLEAFRRGELAIDQVLAVARRAPWWADAEVCELARYATVHQLRKALGAYPFPEIANPDDPTSRSASPDDDWAASAHSDETPAGSTAAEQADGDPAPPTSENRLWFGTGADDRFRMNVDCDQATGMVIAKALDEARDGLFHSGHPDVDWVDAIREVCERSLDSINDLARRDRYRIHVHVDPSGTWLDDHGRRLPAAVARQFGCDAPVTPTVIDGTIPVSIGRSSRTIPERTRRLVILRDGGCRVPGCTGTHILEVHHIIHWEHDGPTDTCNLIALCPHHHRMHHRGELGVTGNADTGPIAFTDRDGTALQPSGARPEPPGAPPPNPAGVWQHPLGERLDTQWLYFNPPPEHRPTPWRRTA